MDVCWIKHTHLVDTAHPSQYNVSIVRVQFRVHISLAISFIPYTCMTGLAGKLIQSAVEAALWCVTLSACKDTTVAGSIRVFLMLTTCWTVSMKCKCTFAALQWRHTGHDGVSNHQPHDCWLDRLFRVDQRKHQSSALLAFVRGIYRWPVKSPHKWPVTRKMLPFDASSWLYNSSIRRCSLNYFHLKDTGPSGLLSQCYRCWCHGHTKSNVISIYGIHKICLEYFGPHAGKANFHWLESGHCHSISWDCKLNWGT